MGKYTGEWRTVYSGSRMQLVQSVYADATEAIESWRHHEVGPTSSYKFFKTFRKKDKSKPRPFKRHKE
jgi:hypothetical protein